MALLPLLGALVLAQTPAQYQIQSQVYSGDKIQVSGKSFRAHVQEDVTVFEGVDSKALFEKNKLQKLFSPTLRVLDGLPGEVKIEGVSEKDGLALKYTAEKKTSGSVTLHTELNLGGALAKTDLTARFGETYVVLTKGKLVLIKVDRVSG